MHAAWGILPEKFVWELFCSLPYCCCLGKTCTLTSPRVSPVCRPRTGGGKTLASYFGRRPPPALTSCLLCPSLLTRPDLPSKDSFRPVPVPQGSTFPLSFPWWYLSVDKLEFSLPPEHIVTFHFSHISVPSYPPFPHGSRLSCDTPLPGQATEPRGGCLG